MTRRRAAGKAVKVCFLSVGTPTLGAMTGVPPALRYRVRELVGLLPKSGEVEGFAADRLERLLADGEPWLGADPTLAEVGYWMIDPARGPELRRRGCIWLTMFPS